jgi:hypothetical protein
VGFARLPTSFVLSFRVDALLRQLTPQVREKRVWKANAVPYSSSLFSGSSVSRSQRARGLMLILLCDGKSLAPEKDLIPVHFLFF